MEGLVRAMLPEFAHSLASRLAEGDAVRRDLTRPRTVSFLRVESRDNTGMHACLLFKSHTVCLDHTKPSIVSTHQAS